ncbi:MAG: NAD(P)-dependent oxidoreductase [Helicobacter sp.]|nr:NAD(P)-dependent oxidoreductase [Helicobacter sp.]
MIERLLQQGALRLKEHFYDLFLCLENKKLLVSGGSGFVGSMFIAVVLCNVKNIKIYCTTRNKARALARFKTLGIASDALNIIEDLQECYEEIDYILCAASPTQSQYFVDYPIQTIDEIYQHTKDLLEFAKDHNVQKFVFLSTMEVYGEVNKAIVGEEDLGWLDVFNPRNSYPAIKRLCEHLIIAYAKEYSLKSCILRLTQVIGAGVSREDKRVYMMFLRESLEEGKITLLTQGETKRDYLDVFDSVSGILLGLLDKEDIACYNLANPKTFMSVLELARVIAEEVTRRGIEVRIQYYKGDTSAFLPSFERSLKISKIQSLGWSPLFSLQESVNAMIESIIEKE